MVRECFPSEEEQFDLYKKVCETTEGREVVIRTLDFGGDQLLPGGPHEKNPFLGYRSTRIFLNETSLFKCQLRVILRASVFGRLKLLFPFISLLVFCRPRTDNVTFPIPTERTDKDGCEGAGLPAILVDKVEQRL
jgi:phosphoenolpyruvate-protein kinase (PTS system EI component)